MTADGTLLIPESAGSLAHTSLDEVDHAVDEVAANRQAWLRTGVSARIALIDEMLETLDEIAADWVAAACEAKGIQPGTPRVGEEWTGGPTTLGQHLDLLRRALVDIERDGVPKLPGRVTTRPTTGQVMVPTAPVRLSDRLLWTGVSAKTWLKPEVPIDGVRQASCYAHPGEGGICALLGAGNVNSIAPTDALTKLFNHNLVVVLKMNPVNEYSGPFLERIMAPLVRGGFLRFVYGGVDVGKRLTQHPTVTHIFMTGSDKTHDAVVWGTGEEGERNRANRTPITDKIVTSELGNVTPLIVVPGPWSKSDIAYQAGHFAGMLTFNSGFNCITPRVIVNHARWRPRDELMSAFHDALRNAGPRRAYYPGARDRWQVMTSEHKHDVLGEDDGSETCVPWTVLRDLDPTEDHAPAFKTEAFNGVLGELALDAPTDLSTYLDQAVEFCNDVLWGSLSAMVFVHPKTMRDKVARAAVERAIDRLEYGSVVVNEWSGLGFGFMSTPWGAYPGHPLHDIQSGRGHAHNTLMVQDIEKTVLRAPFRSPAMPKWPLDPSHARADELAEASYHVWARNRLQHVPTILAASLRG